MNDRGRNVQRVVGKDLNDMGKHRDKYGEFKVAMDVSH